MITPTNNHIIVEPLKHDSFISTDKGNFEEIGIVVAVPEVWSNELMKDLPPVGSKIYFDAWLCGKFPKNDKENFWLVNIRDIKAVETNE